MVSKAARRARTEQRLQERHRWVDALPSAGPNGELHPAVFQLVAEIWNEMYWRSIPKCGRAVGGPRLLAMVYGIRGPESFGHIVA